MSEGNVNFGATHLAEQAALRRSLALSGIRQHGTISAGARAAGVVRHTVNGWRNDDEEFAEAVTQALEDYRDSLSEEITRRGRDGYEEPVVYQGRLCYRVNEDGSLMLDDNFEPIVLTVRKYSDRLLELNAKAFDDRYRDRSSLEVSGPDGGAITRDITVTYVLPEGMTEADYETGGDGDGDGEADPLDD